MKKKNAEVTGKKVASIAGKVLRLTQGRDSKAYVFWAQGTWTPQDSEIITVADLQALAASALTQAEDKPSGGRTIFVSSLAAAMKAVRPGETIKVRKGTYKQKSKRKPVITKIAHYSDKDYGWNVPTKRKPARKDGKK